MSPNGWGVSEVPSVAGDLDGAIAKSDTHLLGVGNGPEVSDSERRVVDGRRISFPTILRTFI